MLAALKKGKTVLGSFRSETVSKAVRSYHDNIIDHYENPRNVGSLEKNKKLCMMFGCGSAIASSSLATEWLKGKTIEECLAIKKTDIAAHLKLPPVKLHCSMLAEDAIKAAAKDYQSNNSAGINVTVTSGANGQLVVASYSNVHFDCHQGTFTQPAVRFCMFTQSKRVGRRMFCSAASGDKTSRDAFANLTNEVVMKVFVDNGAGQGAVDHAKRTNLRGPQLRNLTTEALVMSGLDAVDAASIMEINRATHKINKEQAKPQPICLCLIKSNGSSRDVTIRDQPDFQNFLHLEGYSGLVHGMESSESSIRHFDQLIAGAVYSGDIGEDSFRNQRKLANLCLRHKVEHALEEELGKLCGEPVVLVGTDVPIVKEKKVVGDVDSMFATKSGLKRYLVERKESLSEEQLSQVQSTRARFCESERRLWWR